MPTAHPWDQDKVVKNLLILSDLCPLGRKDKLGAPDAAGIFRVYKPSDGFQFTQRTADDSITRLGDPIRILFVMARRLADRKSPVFQGLHADNLLEGARDGLKRLLGSYRGPFSGGKRRELEGILTEVDEILKGNWQREVLPKILVDSFYVPFGNNLLSRCPQEQILTRGDGVCAALVWDWLRRKLALGKQSWVVSHHHTPHDPNKLMVRDTGAHLNGEDPVRMIKKVYQRIGPLQRAAEDRFFFPDSASEQTAFLKRNTLYAGMVAREVAAGPTTYLATVPNFPAVNADGMDRVKLHGRTTFNEWLVKCQKDVTDRQADGGCYYVGWDDDLGDASQSGHAVGLELRQHRIHFYDPNVGEFEFNSQSELQRFHELGAAVWAFYAENGTYYRRWTIQGFNYVPPPPQAPVAPPPLAPPNPN